MISRQTIDDIFTTARVEEVIGDFVQLKRAGSNLKGFSPFSDEKSPSFMVSPSKQIWKDFSSGKGGNVVTFLMEHEQFTYPEALRWLAKKYNIEIDEERERTSEEIEEQKTKESLFLISEFAKRFFEQQLHKTEEGKNIGLSYFKERGFTKEIIEKFELGYSPSQWDAFTLFAKEKGYSKNLLESSGLVIFREENDRSFDRFRERVIFPILSFSGRTLGFGGRILRQDAKAAKYLNSPESEIYHKSKILYGIFQSKQAILRYDQCYLVEGYTDVISFHQAGIENVVASSGTALTPDQIRLIKRLTPNITIMYDGDQAGIKASFRGIDLILEQELNVKVLLLPEGQDPDSFAQSHSNTEIEKYIAENATDFIQFKAKILLEEAKDDPVKKASLIREIIQSIALIPNIIQRELYIQQTSLLMNIREEVLFKELAQLQNKQSKETTERKTTLKLASPAKKEERIDPFALIEEEIIRLIMQYGDLLVALKNDEGELYETTVIEEIINQFNDNDFELKNPFYQKILEDVKIGFEENELRTGSFFSKLMDEDINQLASEMLMDKYSVSENWKIKQGVYIKKKEDNISKDVYDVILRYKAFYIETLIQDLSKITQGEDFSGEAREELLEKIIKMIQIRNQLNFHLNRVI